MHNMFSKCAFGIAAGICGVIFLGYCVYFDHKRRCDPNFKKNLKERRKLRTLSASKLGLGTDPPNQENHEDAQNFLFRQLQMFGESLAKGDVDCCVDHLRNGLSACQQPEVLMQYIQRTVPPKVFCLLEKKLSEKQKLQFED